MFKSASIKELATALVKAQAGMENAALNKENPHYRSAYADLPSVREAILKPLNDQDIAIAQVPTIDDAGNFQLMTVLMHGPSGEFLAGEYPLPSGRPQEIGSALTFARRYSAAAMVFVAADEDDDANTAEGKPAKVIERVPANDNRHPTSVEKLKPQELAFDNDFVEWGTRFAAQVKLATTEDEKSAWWDLNHDLLNLARDKAPKIYNRLFELFAAGRGQAKTKTDARPTGTAKSAIDSLDSYRLALLAAKNQDELDNVWSSHTYTKSNKDEAASMYDARHKQIAKAA